METYYQMTFAKGGGNGADLSAQQFVKTYGIQELSKVAKLHFKNTEKVKMYTEE